VTFQLLDRALMRKHTRISTTKKPSRDPTAVEGRKPIHYLGHAGGVMPTVEEMVEAAKKALKEGK